MVIVVLGEVFFVFIYEFFLGDFVFENLWGFYMVLNKIVIKGVSLIGVIGVYFVYVLLFIGIIVFVGLFGLIVILLLYMIMLVIYECCK